jgi:hypothetical protein
MFPDAILTYILYNETNANNIFQQKLQLVYRLTKLPLSNPIM